MSRSKFDTCIYAEYFGDYGMRLCNHPSKEKDNVIYSDSCRNCKNYLTEKLALSKNCPFCDSKVHLSQYRGYWHIRCNKCDLEMRNENLDELLKKWRKRK